MAYRYSLRRTVDPSALMTVAEAKEHLAQDHDADDSYIESLVAAAAARLEEATNRAFLNQTIELRLDDFPRASSRVSRWSSPIYVPRTPLVSVSSVAYVDVDGANQTVAASGFDVDVYSAPSRISPSAGNTWPATRLQNNAVTITFVAGYGTSSTDVPADILHAAKLFVAHLYASREPIVTGTIVATIPRNVEYLVAPYIVRIPG